MTELEQQLEDRTISAESYREQQPRLLNELIENDYKWRVTDFLTLGSPLTHAWPLLARSKAELEEKVASREFPCCPPVLENGKFTYPADRAHRTPHHAAGFAPTRWTNLYFPSRFLLWGDLVGGPIAKHFGDSICDVSVTTDQRFGMLSHTLYWTPDKSKTTPSHIEVLRRALALGPTI